MNYYDKNAKRFIEDTISADMSEIYLEFLKRIPGEGIILDAGCGSGRDSLFFLKKGYQIVAFDASTEMVKASSALIGQEVLQMRFEDLYLEEQFHGIWACASLLHVKKEDLLEVVRTLAKHLETGGCFYASFKYGTEDYEKDGRIFSCFTEETFRELIEKVGGLEIQKIGITADVRPGRENEKWLNAFLTTI